jgi:ABC-type glycerol-3-phosphate transport system substrate-binding protein
MSKSKIFVPVVGLVIFTMLLAACGGPASPPEPVSEEPVSEEVEEPVSEEPEEPASEEPEEPVKIGVYTVAWSAPSQEMMATLIEMFNEEHKGKIEAEYIQGDWGEGDSYVTAGVAAGGGIADIVEWWDGGAQAWYEHDLVTDLQPYITPEIRATMPERLWGSRTADDGAVFMSGTCGGMPEATLYYNPAMLEAAGIPTPDPYQPWTWEEFDQYTRMLTLDANGNNLYDSPDQFDHDNVVQWGFLPRLDSEKVWEEGRNFVLQATGETMIRRDDEGKWNVFFDEEGIPALRTFYGVVATGVSPEESIGLTGDSQDELFAGGQGALVLRGFFNVMVLRSRYPDFEFGVMPIPQPKGAKVYSGPSGQGFSVPKVSEHPAEAAEFLFWFQQPKQQAMWASALYVPPANPEALDDPLLTENPDWDMIRYYQSVGEPLEYEYCTNEPEFNTTLYAPTMMEVVQGAKTLEEAMEEIQAAAPDILNQ